jgi:hypothetical protein
VKMLVQYLSIKLIIVLAYMFYLLIPLQNRDEFIPSVASIRMKAFIKMILVLYIIGMSPTWIMNTIVPSQSYEYVPKRFHYRARFKRMVSIASVSPTAILVNGSTWAQTLWKHNRYKVEYSSPNLMSRASPRSLMSFMSFSGTSRTDTRPSFAADTFTIVIDNACSYCITNDVKHYVEPPTSINVPVKGIGGKQVTATLRGTVKWSFTNDQGQVHDEYIPNTYYHQTSPYCLYSPQHVAQIADDNYPVKNGTSCTTYATEMELVCDQRTQKRTIQLDKGTNIFMMQSAPNFDRFHAFNNIIDEANGNRYQMTSPQVSMSDQNMVTDDEGDGENESHSDETTTVQSDRYHPDLPSDFDAHEPSFTACQPIGEGDQPSGEIAQVPTEDVDIQANSDQAQLLGWHYRLGHLPFAKIQQMAARGDLPAN